MKKIVYVASILIMVSCIQLNAQSWIKKMGNRVKEKVIDKVEQKIDDKTDKVLEKGYDNLDKGKQVKNEKGQINDVTYRKYDFIPGNEVIFEDDLRNEQKGEFPSKWDLLEGNAEIASINNENVISFVGYTYITPLFKDKNFKLPDEFTMEFNFYLDGHEGENSVELVNDNDGTVASSLFWKTNDRFIFKWGLSEKERSSEDKYNNNAGWHHYALSFNKRAIKVYIDDRRVANIPNFSERPVKIKLFARGEDTNSTFQIKDIRIAKGAVPLYDRLMTDGKIISYGITFEIGKANIKPESMGTINEIYNILKNHTELKLSIEGHTDNTGKSADNLTLSENRAKAVYNKLIEMGIDKNQLSTKGYGMSKPIDTNGTAEGRAKNRRVEFVSIK